MVDPKMVELAPFNGLPHLLCPVVTEAKKVSAALNWVLAEMDERYKLLAKAGSRTIEAYNEKNEPMPYIVIIIDEFADLMVVAGDQIENAVTRLAQMARAVGIHLILATQRPSVDVITGVIKANLPARISFKVASGVDARTILDSTKTSEKLLGKGDMLFMLPGESELIRLQGTLVYDKEIERVVDFIRSQAEPLYNEEILKEQQKTTITNGEKDELYDEAVRVVMESNQASVSILQRRMRLSHTRAARIIDSMEQEGLVGPFEGSKPRKILVNREEWLDRSKQIDQSEGQ
jgi:S-DNA-T family DNA segregation ATPase FtsK/SpoIIIE